MSMNTETCKAVYDVEEQLTKDFQEVDMFFAKFRTEITNMQSRVRAIERNAKREIRALKKNADKNKNRKVGNRKASGFATPTNISPELLKFMGKEAGVKVARTEVTQFIITYIKNNNLGVSKEITLDENLKTLLGAKCGDNVTYFNLQRFMNKHFIKSEKQTGEETSSETVV